MHKKTIRGRIKEGLHLDRASVIHIIIAVIVSLIFCAIIVNNTSVGQDVFTEEMAEVKGTVNGFGARVVDNEAALATVYEQYGGVANTVGQHTGDIGALQTRMATAEGNITRLGDRINEVGSPPEGYLTGSPGNYTLHARASQAGNYTANIHLVFAPAVATGNDTLEGALDVFLGTITWNATYIKPYVPVLSYNGTGWVVTEVWWNLGTFALPDGTKDITVLFGGLPRFPTYSYVEIYPVLKYRGVGSLTYQWEE